MAKPLLPDELWEVIEPLLPKWTPSPKGGQPPVTDRAALTGILFILKTGLPWEDLPCEMNCGCGMTCWRRLRDWQADGTWDKIHKVLLDKLRGADKIDWSRALIDSSFVRAAYGGEATGPSPVDRAKPGTKHHLLTDAGGIPLASSVTAANVSDISQLAPLYNKVPPVAGKVGRPRKKPDALQGDLAYDSEPHRQGLREMGVEPVLPEKGIDDQSGLGETRWPVERTLAWVHQNRRLRIRYDRRPDIHQAFLTLACIKNLCKCIVRRVLLDALSGGVSVHSCVNHVFDCCSQSDPDGTREGEDHGNRPPSPLAPLRDLAQYTGRRRRTVNRCFHFELLGMHSMVALMGYLRQPTLHLGILGKGAASCRLLLQAVGASLPRLSSSPPLRRIFRPPSLAPDNSLSIRPFPVLDCVSPRLEWCNRTSCDYQGLGEVLEKRDPCEKDP